MVLYPSSGESLGSIGWKGADSANTNAAAGAFIEAIASQDHSGSAEGTSLAFHTKPDDTGPGSAPTKRMTILQSGNVGIGTATPAAPLNIKTTADGTLLRFGRSGVCDWDISIGNTPITAGGSSGDLEIIPQNTNMGFAVGTTGAGLNGRFRDGVLTLGSGIKFNSDTAAANMLDDYEEGTWTPTVSSDAAPSAYNYATGYYTKIGRVVHLTGQLRVSDMGSMTGATINAGGFPFTVANLTNYDPRGVVGLVSAATAKSDIFCRGVANSTYARVENNNGATTSDRNMNANAFDTDTVFFIDLTFVIA
jgi:hypothetical protein